MTDDTADGRPGPHRGSGLGHAVRTLPAWKLKLLGLSLAVGVVGLAGQFVSANLRHTAPVAAAPPTHAAPAGPGGFAPPGSSGFVGGGPTAPDVAPSAPPPASQAPTLTDRITPQMTGIGLSFFVGLVVGFVFRVFLRLGVTIAAVIVALAVALSYFHVINVDLNSVRGQTAQATSWLGEQLTHLKVLIFAYLPSSTAAGAGFLFGMKRR